MTSRTGLGKRLPWLLATVLLSSTNASGQSDGTQMERFLRERQTAWANYRSASGRLQGSVSVSRSDHTGKRQREHWRTEMKQAVSNKCALTLRQEFEPPTKSQSEVLAMNSRYAFHLSRRGPAGAWLLTGLDTSPRWPETSVAVVGPAQSVSSLVCQNLRIFNVWLADLVKEPEFSLKSVGMADWEGRQLIRVEFDRPSKVLVNNPVRGGWVLLDPDHYWLAHAFEVNGEWVDGTGTIAGTFKHKEGSDGLPILTRYVWRQKAHSRTDGPVDFDYTFDYDLREQETVPEDEFTLSAFGLPEPEGIGPSRMYLWVILGGALLVALAVFFRLRVRRAQAA